jgi:hypothetical protein
MYINYLKENSGALMFRAALVFLLSLFVVGMVPGLLNIGISQAQAHDGRDDWGHHRWYHRPDACAQTSNAALTACQFAAQEEYNLALGNCANVARSEQDDCKAVAKEEYGSAMEECTEQFDARQEVCAAIGPGPYLPDGIDPDDFAPRPTLSEGYFPLVPGTTYVYKNYAEDGDIQETIVVHVVEGEDGIREIEGVNCRVVQDTVYEGNSRDEKIEDTTDWYALNTNGDVWYFGEIALNFEDGVVSDIDGSWTTGVEGAKPGILMYADPAAHEDETYRQEFALSEAEDVATIVEILTKREFAAEVGYDADNPVPAVFGDGPFLHTLEFSPLEPGVFEDKYYGLGVGNVLIVNEDTGEREVLIRKTP